MYFVSLCTGSESFASILYDSVLSQSQDLFKISLCLFYGRHPLLQFRCVGSLLLCHNLHPRQLLRCLLSHHAMPVPLTQSSGLLLRLKKWEQTKGKLKEWEQTKGKLKE
jgi:hypothetical protein